MIYSKSENRKAIMNSTKKSIIKPKGKNRVSREMKTPSFGNASGADDHYAMFKVKLDIIKPLFLGF